MLLQGLRFIHFFLILEMLINKEIAGKSIE